MPVAVARVPQRTRSVAPLLVAVVLFVAIAAAGFVVARPSAGPAHAVPLLSGRSEADAKDLASRAKFLYEIELVRHDDPKGYVFGQSPAPGAFLAEGSTIHLRVSTGLKPVPIPAVKGKTEAEAIAALNPLFLPKSVPTADEEVPAGQVIGTKPTRLAQPDSAIQVFVSTGPRPRIVPNVVGKSYDQAVELLQVTQLGADRQEEFSDTVKKDVVIRSDPPPGAEAPRDSPVKVYVSKGKDVVLVPDFVGKTIKEATDLATVAGVEIEPTGVFTKNRKVVTQLTKAGEQVPRGTIVRIFF